MLQINANHETKTCQLIQQQRKHSSCMYYKVNTGAFQKSAISAH